MEILSRESILTNTHLKTETVDVPEWGGAVIVSELTGTDRDAWESTMVDQSGQATSDSRQNARAKLVIRSLVDEDGARIFADDDLEVVGRLSATGLNRVFEAAAELSGLTPDDLEELEGN